MSHVVLPYTFAFSLGLLWVIYSARVAKRMLTFLTTRYPDLFQSKKIPWYVATDEDCPK